MIPPCQLRLKNSRLNPEARGRPTMGNPAPMRAQFLRRESGRPARISRFQARESTFFFEDGDSAIRRRRKGPIGGSERNGAAPSRDAETIPLSAPADGQGRSAFPSPLLPLVPRRSFVRRPPAINRLPDDETYNRPRAATDFLLLTQKIAQTISGTGKVSINKPD